VVDDLLGSANIITLPAVHKDAGSFQLQLLSNIHRRLFQDHYQHQQKQKEKETGKIYDGEMFKVLKPENDNNNCNSNHCQITINIDDIVGIEVHL
jgi:fido (protein-threonine AMPylation protein)